MKRIVRLTEQELKSIITESVENAIGPQYDENDVEFGDSEETSRGKHVQPLKYKGRQVGYLVTKEKNRTQKPMKI